MTAGRRCAGVEAGVSSTRGLWKKATGMSLVDPGDHLGNAQVRRQASDPGLGGIS